MRARIPPSRSPPAAPRRRALDAALAEIEQGAREPSTAWRREFSLLLGLERVLSEEEPHLVDGTVLSPHQVDALSGTLTALLADALRTNGNGNGNGAAAASPELLASADILGADDEAAVEPLQPEPPVAVEEDEDELEADLDDADLDDEEDLDEDDLDDELDAVAPAAPEDDLEEDDEDEEELDLDDELALDEAEDALIVEDEADEEPRDWVDEDEDEEGQLPEQPEDPNAAKRFWFEHATGAGKTIAALGFVEAARTGGVLILTHRRNLVDQFHGELTDRGYKSRISRPLLKGEDAANGPVTVQTYQWFVRNAGTDLQRLHDRHLRRGAHRARREDERRDPRLDRPDLHRHDGDRRAHRPPRLRSVPDPDLALRPRAGRPPRRDRAAALRAHPARARACARSPRCRCAAARSTRVRPGDARRAARPAPVQLGGRRPLQDALQRRARRRLRRRRAPRLQPRGGVPRHRAEGQGGLRRDAQARAGRDPRPLRARRDRRAHQRAAARRGLELAARDRLHASRPDRLQAHLPAARRAASRAATRARRRGSSSTSCTPRPSTTSRSSRCTRCSTATSTAAARSSSGRCGAGADGGCASSAACCRCAPTRSGGSRSSSASCGGSPSSISTTASSTCGRRWPARAWRRAAGGGRGRCCTSIAAAS